MSDQLRTLIQENAKLLQELRKVEYSTFSNINNTKNLFNKVESYLSIEGNFLTSVQNSECKLSTELKALFISREFLIKGLLKNLDSYLALIVTNQANLTPSEAGAVELLDSIKSLIQKL